MYIMVRSLVINAFCITALYGADSSTSSTPGLYIRQNLTACSHAFLQLPKSNTIVVAGLSEHTPERKYKYLFAYFTPELKSKPGPCLYTWVTAPIAELTHNNEESIHALFPITMRDIRGPQMEPHVDHTKLISVVKSHADHAVYTATPSGHVVAVFSHPLHSRERILSLYSTDIREIPLHEQLDREETIHALALSADGSLAAWATDWGNLGMVITHKPFSRCKLHIERHARCTAVAINNYKTKAACCYTIERGEPTEIIAYCALFLLKNVPCIAPQLLQRWEVLDPVTTCMFLHNGKLLVGTTGKKIYLYD